MHAYHVEAVAPGDAGHGNSPSWLSRGSSDRSRAASEGPWRKFGSHCVEVEWDKVLRAMANAMLVIELRGGNQGSFHWFGGGSGRHPMCSTSPSHLHVDDYDDLLILKSGLMLS